MPDYQEPGLAWNNNHVARCNVNKVRAGSNQYKIRTIQGNAEMLSAGPTLMQQATTDQQAFREIRYANWKVRHLAAQSYLCPPSVLEVLADDLMQYVRYAVAEHPNCPSHVLEMLAADGNHDIRRAVARHHNCPPHVISKLANDRSELIRKTVADRSDQQLDNQITS